MAEGEKEGKHHTGTDGGAKAAGGDPEGPRGPTARALGHGKRVGLWPCMHSGGVRGARTALGSTIRNLRGYTDRRGSLIPEGRAVLVPEVLRHRQEKHFVLTRQRLQCYQFLVHQPVTF